MVFSEQIFESQFVASEEVEALLTALGEMKAKPRDRSGDDEMGQLLQRAIDALTLLSAKK
ncbi:hypothetical protein LCGC14_1833370 [marine sediment metagenome]|uniref:Uncharacterized protein n=1 Tax=marine sediment metagenome TaxID=412755 RepID=A0A0F9GFC5_9ZZZZ